MVKRRKRDDDCKGRPYSASPYLFQEDPQLCEVLLDALVQVLQPDDIRPDLAQVLLQLEHQLGHGVGPVLLRPRLKGEEGDLLFLTTTTTMLMMTMLVVEVMTTRTMAMTTTKVTRNGGTLATPVMVMEEIEEGKGGRDRTVWVPDRKRRRKGVGKERENKAAGGLRESRRKKKA